LPAITALLMALMPELTRRCSADAREACWHIYDGDVRVGTIARRVGNPFDTDPWEWTCEFYSRSHPTRECTNGTSETFDQALADFDATWRVFKAHRGPIFRRGATRETGTLRSTAGSIGASVMPHDRKPPHRAGAPAPTTLRRRGSSGGISGRGAVRSATAVI
jgi:hypothetical protein